MEYKKINDATVQCIVTAEDMIEYGLTLSDIFERNEKGEGFLRDIIERAQDEVGYAVSGESIAMQITPLQDRGLAVTFTNEGPKGFRDILQHLKDVLRGVSAELDKQDGQEALERLEGIEELKALEGMPPPRDIDFGKRVAVFHSLRDTMRYAASIPRQFTVKSQLYKVNGEYYLIMYKNRLSYRTINKLSAQAVEFGKLILIAEEDLAKIHEQADCLIADRAVSRLRRIYRA